MNREQRRELERQGVSKETVNKFDAMQSPCTIAEAIQLSRATAEDVLMDYAMKNRPLQVSLALQVEILKETLIKAGMIREDFFERVYKQKIEEFNQKQKERFEKEEETPETTKMSVQSNDIQVKVEE